MNKYLDRDRFAIRLVRPICGRGASVNLECYGELISLKQSLPLERLDLIPTCAFNILRSIILLGGNKMLRILTVLSAAFSVQAFACPNLTGNFTCSMPDGSTQVMDISSRMEGAVTYYKVSGDEFPADGSVLKLADSQELKNGTFSATCMADTTLSTNIKGEYFNSGKDYGPLDLNINYSMAGENLQFVTDGTLNAKTIPAQTVTCNKN